MALHSESHTTPEGAVLVVVSVAVAMGLPLVPQETDSTHQVDAHAVATVGLSRLVDGLERSIGSHRLLARVKETR